MKGAEKKGLIEELQKEGGGEESKKFFLMNVNFNFWNEFLRVENFEAKTAIMALPLHTSFIV